MARPVAAFSVCDLRRAIKTACKLGFEISGYEIAPSGAISVHVRSYKVDADGTVHSAPGGKLEDLGLPMTGEAAA